MDYLQLSAAGNFESVDESQITKLEAFVAVHQ
mgnify:CR=1 FL=1|jgi:hypothetical protein